jgi:predicted nucleic acid-binding protein
LKHGIDTGFLVAAEVVEHPDHHAARTKLAGFVGAGDVLVIVPQVLAEFIHVVTDARLFKNPLDMDSARDLAEKWWTAREVEQLSTGAGAVGRFFAWHRTHGLGRKRILDTMLAATYWDAGIGVTDAAAAISDRAHAEGHSVLKSLRSIQTCRRWWTMKLSGTSPATAASTNT